MKLKTPEHQDRVEKYISLFVNLFLLYIIAISIYTSLKLLMSDRSLWLDEAMLAYSFSQRGLTDLTSSIFEWMQSAPVIYLYIVKIITTLFGNSEITLRLWSFISYILLLFSVFYISKSVLKVRFPLFATAFIASLYRIILYSAEFKPYMSDCLSIFIVLIIYYLYTEKKINKPFFIASYALLIWFSNPCCFFIGSVLLAEFIIGIKNRDRKQWQFSIIAGIFILVSFIVYYFYWLKPVIDEGGMSSYWKDNKFPLIPTSIEDIYKQGYLINVIIYSLGLYKNLIFAVFAVGIFINLFIEKNRFINIIYGGVFITLFASMLGMYPIQDRLYLFMYPIFGILFFFFLGKLYTSIKTGGAIALTISVIILISSDASSFFKNSENIYRFGDEGNFAINYIRDNISAGDKLYVYNQSIPVFSYKNGYNMSDFAGYKNNTILGKTTFENNKNKEDIARIVQSAPIYILTSHTTGMGHKIMPLLDSLSNRGDLQLVHNKYDTYVYYYRNNDSIKVKLHQ